MGRGKSGDEREQMPKGDVHILLVIAAGRWVGQALTIEFSGLPFK
jgi:hypothetical protein